MRKMIRASAAILLPAASSRALRRGGMDFKHFALRPQLDYIGTSFSGTHVDMVRGSFGIVFRFGNH